MTQSNNLRYFFFKKVEALKGNKRIKHYHAIKEFIEKGKENNVQLSKLLNHASTTTPFYSALNTPKNLSAFPIINKNIIKNNYENFKSTAYKKTKNRVAATSGSTGAPFKILQNPNKVNRNSADTIYFSEMAGFNIGYKLYYFRLWKAYERKNFFARWTLNMVPIDVFNLKGAYIKKFIETLKGNKTPKSWTGYASAFEAICKYMDKNKLNPVECNLKSAIAISESLTPYTKEKLKKHFNVNAVSRYSNVENGIIAQQMPKTSNFIINTASYYVEILDFNTDLPVEYGQRGRIVITDLFNFCMPMIRYDTGDIGVMDKVGEKRVLSSVEGRQVDVITNTKGEPVPNSLMMLVNNYHQIDQCQLIQKSKNSYVIKINIDGEFKNESKFITEFKSYLGDDALIKIDYVNEIPLLASGKRRAMVNETATA